jgi:hypothetical protein
MCVYPFARKLPDSVRWLSQVLGAVGGSSTAFFGVNFANFYNASLFFPNTTRRIMSSSSYRGKGGV